MKAVHVGPIVVERGRRVFGRLQVARMADGQDLSIGVHVVAGAQDGPTLVVVCTQHGNEINPIACFPEVLRQVEPARLTGALVLVPVANPIAFEMGLRTTWHDALYHASTGNLNRVWPGLAHGFLTERISAALATSVIEGADVVIDIHASTNRSISIYYGYVPNDDSDLGRRGYELSMAFGMEIMLRRPRYPGTTLIDYVYDYLRKPIVAVELGEFYGFEQDHPNGRPFRPIRSVPEVGVTGITNVMKAMSMLQGPVVRPKRQIIISPEHRCLPDVGGLLIPEVHVEDIGRVVPRGYRLGTIIDAMSLEEVGSIEAPFNQNLLLSSRDLRPLARINPGDQAFHVGDMSTAEWVTN